MTTAHASHIPCLLGKRERADCRSGIAQGQAQHRSNFVEDDDELQQEHKRYLSEVVAQGIFKVGSRSEPKGNAHIAAPVTVMSDAAANTFPELPLMSMDIEEHELLCQEVLGGPGFDSPRPELPPATSQKMEQILGERTNIVRCVHGNRSNSSLEPTRRLLTFPADSSQKLGHNTPSGGCSSPRPAPHPGVPGYHEGARSRQSPRLRAGTRCQKGLSTPLESSMDMRKTAIMQSILSRSHARVGLGGQVLDPSGLSPGVLPCQSPRGFLSTSRASMEGMNSMDSRCRMLSPVLEPVCQLLARSHIDRHLWDQLHVRVQGLPVHHWSSPRHQEGVRQ